MFIQYSSHPKKGYMKDKTKRGEAKRALPLLPLSSSNENLSNLETHQLRASERVTERKRKEKTQYMLDQLSELQNKEQMLMETNRALSIKLEEISARNQFRVLWKGGEQSVAFTNQQDSHLRSKKHRSNSLGSSSQNSESSDKQELDLELRLSL
ncbi:hypothetical protein GOBAR_DD00839 [Gossypium barbadense]|nr:hypothetical protein GOBAR_DD00839 [Gossypium barbadense]